MRHILGSQSSVSSRRNMTRRAFGLIELLVVMAIIAFLVGFLLGFVQRARQGTARISCVNNLKQIVLASHSYHDVNSRFPPGYGTDTGAGVLMNLLPYIEQQPLYNQLPEALRDGKEGSWLKQLGGLKANSPASAKIPEFLCPDANNAPSVEGTVQSENFTLTPAAAGSPAKYTFGFTPNKGDTTMGLTNYVGNAGMYFFDKDGGQPKNAGFATGPFFADSKTRLTDITDGTSNTLAFGEALGGSESGPPTYNLTWVGTGVLPTYWDCQTPSTWFTFGSNHPGVVNFAFCDGSVRGISKVKATDKSSIPPPNPPAAINSPRWVAFQLLGGMSDNKTPDWSQLGTGAAGN